MTHDVPRRRIAQTAAWAVPTVALVSAAPQASASGVTPTPTPTPTPTLPVGCFLTDEQLNAGVCSAPSILAHGALVFSTTGGGIANATTNNDIALKSSCHYLGSTTAYWTANFGVGATVPAATLRLADGTVYSGRTGGAISSGGHLAGFAAANSVTWLKSNGIRPGVANSTGKDLTGAVVTVPFVWRYTAPDSSVHDCMYALQYTMSGPYSSTAQPMINPTIVAI